jgi:hypothetical protein
MGSDSGSGGPRPNVLPDGFSSPFTPESVAAIEKRCAMLAPHERPILWRHAALPEHEQLRSWLDNQLRRLDATTAREFAARLRDSRRYTQALAELATGYVLRQPGYGVEFAPRLGQLTPDLIVTEPGGQRLIVEVWRRGQSQATVRRNAGWDELARQVRRIPLPVAIHVHSAARTVVEPPDAAGRRSVERGLRAWLGPGGVPATSSIEIEGLEFRVVGTTNTGRAEILPVQASATTDRKDIVEAIEKKVGRYRRLAEEMDLPLVVVLSADPDTGLDASLVGHVLAGSNAMTMTIPIFAVGAFDSGKIEMRRTDAPPVFDSALSAVAWLEINDGVRASLDPLWPNPVATRKVLPR